MCNLFFSLPNIPPTYRPTKPIKYFISVSFYTHTVQFQQYTSFLVRFLGNKLKPNCPRTGIPQHKTANTFEVNIIFFCQSGPVRSIIHIYPQDSGISNPRQVGFFNTMLLKFNQILCYSNIYQPWLLKHTLHLVKERKERKASNKKVSMKSVIGETWHMCLYTANTLPLPTWT